ncbi:MULTISPECIES: restriction endonuclease subunit S [unclassified Delftia]|uniref:restriction endonuclease subunit S n=1 Tax=unclassified Delftia TaxID=2613839 RepID=UPI00190168AC|nr:MULTISPECIES: restriction endonuclease subunit S [unclassified Delftia]MBK0110951.1 restriction endonuclease subunit S [Delftia sp. S65]MBK0116299.1 restriction endonuclease subunit S [Delftia sp. S67]MBK0129785.1 restriction endonuclease subunit S [Delftia sp. S66]
MTIAIPSGWLNLELGEVLDYGLTQKIEPQEISAETWVLELEDIEKNSSRVLQRFNYAQRNSKSTKNKFAAGDVLYGKLRPYLNKVIFADSEGVCTTEIVPLRSNFAVHAKYLFHWLKHPKFLNYVTEVSHGVNMPRLGSDAGRKAPFILAPFQEQCRIADKLDTILTRVDALNDRLARITPLIKRFRQSVLAAATSGRLTEGWRAHYKCNYIQTSLKAVCEKSRVITYGVVKLGNETQDGVPCLRTSNVRWLRFDLDGTKLIDPGLSAEYARTVLQGGEVLVNVRGTLGGVAVAQPSMVGWNVSREVAVVPVDKDIAVPAFIALWIASDECQRWLTGVTKGVAYAGINIEDLRALPVILPIVAEQTEIVRRVEILFAYADRLEARLQTARTTADRLTPALLAKAFRGELVPQDPNDEPATELLRRLREARAAEAPAKKVRGRKAQVV